MTQDHSRHGVLLVALGTPDSPTPAGVRAFLKEFLSDPRVVDLNPLIWKPVLYGIILNVRPRKVAKAYQSIWTENGSPLMHISKLQQQKLTEKLEAMTDWPIPVELGMTYGNPSLSTGLKRLQEQNVDKVVVLPVFPQYSCSTVAPVSDGLAKAMLTRRNVPEVRMQKEYHLDPDYISALADSVRRHWDANGRADKLLMSFHGVPQRYVDEGDPYEMQCHATGDALAEALGLSSDEYLVTFQSRFGKEPWLQPYTDETVNSLPKQGVKSLDVICPAFSADCLETLEEIAEEVRDEFLEAGGERYQYIPCLNDDDAHIELMAKLALAQMQGF
ncbi:ferrochelatase [Paraferrimonas sedimenticola]|uniref:Ferrochelatase n=1 Tax=Paraferrimonas sedimenticola TaxID=375674 RepID=A0AA37RX40_9GAMM|nr:ferrochelatase [Paraferrimonas sedimenticola]GLP96900.1 ferrochelatase 1 [Paraferrimonas sedimenticola]